MSEHIWIYHERQQALLCGQHALNNLVQACNFSPESLAEIAHQLDEMELQFMSQNNEGGIHSKEYLARVAEVRLRSMRGLEMNAPCNVLVSFCGIDLNCAT